MPEVKPNVNYEGAIRQIEECVHSVFNKGVKYGRYLERQEQREPEKENVRKGIWEKVENGGFYWFECSECGNRPMRNGGGFMTCSAYCPNCGAEMSREDEQDAD